MARNNVTPAVWLTRARSPSLALPLKPDAAQATTGSQMNPAVLRIALDTPLRRLFDYLPPAAPVAAGQRVRVPFGRQRLVGLVVEETATSDLPAERLKPVLEVLDSEAVLDRSAIELVKWAADYYHHPIGEVIATAMPKALREGA